MKKIDRILCANQTKVMEIFFFTNKKSYLFLLIEFLYTSIHSFIEEK